MNKLKLFLENFLIYGLGSVAAKAVPLLMLPVVTRLMPNTEFFGISDMSTTIASLCSAIAVMGMYDAMYRLFFDSEEEKYRKEICATTFAFTWSSSLIIFIVMLLAREWLATIFFGSAAYVNVVCITAVSTLMGATNTIISAPTRLQNKRRVYVTMNVVAPLLAYSISIPLLMRGWYLLALPLASAVSAIAVQITFYLLNRRWFPFHKAKKKYLRPLLKLALPLLPNYLFYWLLNSGDRVMITNLMGMAQTGIYSAGAKMGQLSQLIYLAFGGGWQFFAFSTMKEKDQVKTNSFVLEYLGTVSFAVTMLVFALCRPIYNIVFTEEFSFGYIVAPYLFLAPLLQMLFQVATNQFLVIKKTWPSMLILLSAAVANILLNLLLIPRLGIEGAAIATLLGYVLANVVAIVVLIKLNLMQIQQRFLFCVLVITGYIVLWRVFLLDHWFAALLMALIAIALYIELYRNDLRLLFAQLHSWLKKDKMCEEKRI